MTKRFLWGPEPKYGLNLRVGDLCTTPGDAIHIQIRGSKAEAGKAAGERPSHVNPPSKSATPELPFLSRPRLQRVHRRTRSPQSKPLSYPLTQQNPGGRLTRWLPEGLADIKVVPPLGKVHSSHSSRAGFITAGRAGGLYIDALCQFAGLTRDVLETPYLDTLALETSEAHIFFAGLVPMAVSVPSAAAVLTLCWYPPRFTLLCCHTVTPLYR